MNKITNEESKKINDYLVAHPPVYNEDKYYARMSNILGVSQEGIRKRCRSLELTHIRMTKQVKGKVNVDEKKINVEDIKLVVDKVFEKTEERKRLSPKFIEGEKLKSEKWLQIFSDLHYGLVVDKVEVGDLGHYNVQTTRERLEYLVNIIGRILEYYPNRPEELYIAFLGDNIENAYMQANQQSRISIGICQQIIEVEELLIDYIIALSKYFPVIKIFAIVGGNHGRMGKRRNDTSPTDNFEYIIYNHMSKRLANMEGIHFNYTSAKHMIVDINDWKFWLEHGDTVRSWMGLPFYGMKREKANINDMLAKFREHADYLLAGHFHTKANFEDIFMNGSFVGGDAYSIGDLRRMDLPYQKLLGVNRKHGVVWNRDICLIDDPRSLKIKIYS